VLRPGAAVEITADLIRERVAAEWGVSVDGLMSKRRTKDLTVPRQVAMYLIREMLDLSLVEIGNLFGGRDHSTVIHAVNKVEEELALDDAFRARVELLSNGLGAEDNDVERMCAALVRRPQLPQQCA
jgi:chromosomal replication initiator protein